ncbi:hypothetical protein NA57DRAFT_54842 [Rhizodiscina lignyota]|uniref:Uncharacterized protein n=1 Tax=Rhizodiscina lignyota TaxID=1504668 RepID=A0A9P4IGU8_9PEZI|nr:hypothetical protein NA57DRAFT_54842 [Rhizodiscina lignyota]
MSDAMEWSQDFCLSCDNVNPTDGPYCSEACRLLDSDKSTESADSHTALYSQSYTPTRSTWTMSSPNRSSGMYLPPAVNFSALRTPAGSAGTMSLPNSPRSAANGSYFAPNSGASVSPGTRYRHSHSSSRRSLTTSSSRSSLSSISTSTSGHGLSDQTINQLRNYVNSFDHTRELKRRQTLA